MTETSVAVEDTLDWDVFAEKYWDRAPVLYRRVPGAPFVAEEALRAAVTASAPGPADAIPDIVRLTCEGRRLLRARDRVPCASDTDFDSYAARVTTALDGQRHALVIAGFHPHDPELWDRQRAFFRPLWERVGLPMTSAITTLFHGNYEHSPVGVHKDRFGTFMYVLSGRKRMRMWPTRPWSHDASTILDYACHLDTSIAAEAGPGQLMYWPASHYHVGETVGSEPATSVNVGVPREGRRVEFEITDLLTDLPAAALTDPDAFVDTRMPPIDVDPFVDPAEAAAGVPLPLRRGMREAVSLLERSWEGERRLAVTLNRYTAGGFRPVPDPAPRPELTDATRLRRAAGATVLWARTADATALCSGNGHTASARPSPEAITALLARLDATAEPATVGELLAEVGESEREHCRELLAELCAFRVLTA